MKHPKVTVLMPVYNGGKYLTEAIESILSQSYSDFEFLIVNDVSTDNSVEIIKSFSDKRIRLVHNKKNMGQAISLNIGIKLAKGKYIVRMDADDICLPDRIKKQVEYMDVKPMIGISGTSAEIFDRHTKGTWQVPTSPEKIKFLLLFQNTIIHPTVIMRKELLMKNNLFFRPLYETAEDYDLWVRASMFTSISNLSDTLLLYRIHPEQVTVRAEDRQNKVVKMIRFELLSLLGILPTNEEYKIHELLSEYKLYKKDNTKETILEAEAWLNKLDMANEIKQIFNVPLFSEYLADEWFKVCSNACRFGIWTFKTFYSTDLSNLNEIHLMQKLKFAVKCILKYN